jgi:hypothetical protein
MWWILYCAMQAVPAIDPTPHTAFDSQEKCFKQAEVSNSFGELHCVCADEPGGYRVIDANGLGLAHVDGEPRTPAPSRTSGYHCRQLPAGAAPLPQSRDPAPAQAYAGAGDSEASRLLEVRRHRRWLCPHPCQHVELLRNLGNPI